MVHGSLTGGVWSRMVWASSPVEFIHTTLKESCKAEQVKKNQGGCFFL